MILLSLKLGLFCVFLLCRRGDRESPRFYFSYSVFKEAGEQSILTQHPQASLEGATRCQLKMLHLSLLNWLRPEPAEGKNCPSVLRADLRILVEMA
ncbi:MAG: hypothetical protein DRP56_05310, partial [Planctomycetota bacterium]